MKYLAVLGRLPEISIAELSALYGDSVRQLSQQLATFTLPEDQTPQISRLGGSLKLARELSVSPQDYLLQLSPGKITLGVSDYSHRATTHSVRGVAMKLKRYLTRNGRSIRILENKSPVLSTATSHHNQLGEKPNHIELILVDKTWYLGLGTQNITAYAHRDQKRPARDAKVGMLPPKLAQILINLCGSLPPKSRLLDPFCGTGVVLQEATLMGYTPYGTDLNPRMVEYSQKNLDWLMASNISSYHPNIEVQVGDATSYQWSLPLDAVACETYLGPPLSNPPSEIKLKEIKQQCRSIVLGFLKNISTQLRPNTSMALAIPAWRRFDGTYSRLNILDELPALGYNVIKYQSLGLDSLLYYREGQVVAREIIVLRKK